MDRPIIQQAAGPTVAAIQGTHRESVESGLRNPLGLSEWRSKLRRRSQRQPGDDLEQRFSWTRCIISLTSYALLLSDVLRTGLGIRITPRELLTLEPDQFVFVGPYAYLVNHLTQTNGKLGTSNLPYWAYKYDTTSVGIRALAEVFALGSWPRCVMYQETCDESRGLSPATVFGMIHELVEAISNNAAQRRQPDMKAAASQPPVSLRIKSEYKDRLHDYVAPWFFDTTIKRTIQAHYFAWDAEHQSRSICGSGSSGYQPLSCKHNWTHQLKASCSNCSRSVWEEIAARMEALAILYPGRTIDFLLVHGVDDVSRGGVSFQGRQRAEIVVLSRIRSCGRSQHCTTVAVDDFRFEAASIGMNASDWFSVVATLRVVAQSYTWVRVLLLVGACYTARRQASPRYRELSVIEQVRSLVRTLFLIPSQVVIYGSLTPVSLYFVAHLIDSPALYELVSIRFYSLFGTFTWHAADFINHCAVSMRTVWGLGVLCHLSLAVATRCAWSPSRGIPGVPELFISCTASLTVFAQYRAISLRSVRILQIVPIVPSSRLQALQASRQNANAQSMLRPLLVGSPIDLQSLLSAAMGLAVVMTMMWLTNRLLPQWFPFQVSLVSRTLVPYSAGTLWPRSRLVVNWFGTVCRRPPRRTLSFLKTFHPPMLNQGTFTTFGATKPRLSRSIRNTTDRGLVMHENDTASSQMLTEMQCIDKRSREVDSAIYLMNLALMTDPLTMLQLRLVTGRRVGVFMSTLTHEYFLVPLDVRLSPTDSAIDWRELTLEAIVNTKDLDWDELLRLVKASASRAGAVTGRADAWCDPKPPEKAPGDESRLLSRRRQARPKSSLVRPVGTSASGADVTIDWHELRVLVLVNTNTLDWDELLHIG